MKYKFVLPFVCGFVSNAFGVETVTSYYGGEKRYALNEDTVITSTGRLVFSAIDITNAIHLTNYGIIDSDVYIQSGNAVCIQNAGDINGRVYIEGNSNLTQIIRNASDIVGLDVDSGYQISVSDSSESLSLNSVVAIANNANKIVVKDSDLILNGPAIFAGDIEFNGNVILHLNYSTNYDGIALANITNNGHVEIDGNLDNPLYVLSSEFENNNLYVRVVRETDYAKVFNNDLGLFLNKLRNTDSGDKLVAALDLAPDMDAVNRIMTRSARLNPKLLMRPVKIMNRFLALDTAERGFHNNLSGHASYIFSDVSDMMILGAHIDISDSYNVVTRINTYVGAFSESDSLDDYMGGVVGADISAHYDDSLFAGRMAMGLNISAFDVGDVFDGRRAVNNPVGTSVYYNAEFGVHAIRNVSFDVVPYIGVLGDVNYIVGKSDSRMAGNIGTDILFGAGDWNVKYFYGARGGVLTDGGLYLNGIIRFVLPDDDISGELSLGVINDDAGTSYKISIMGRYAF